ncbi:MAG: protein kinase [Caldilineaceae bacterium]|nr:protein kinase [Caldilineaceae bacterium]
MLGKSVALKILLPNADENTYNRFRREALTAGALRHPHIVRIIQVGTAIRGDVAYIAMELVEGESLSDLLAQRGQLRPEESCNLLEPIARALAYAHEAGIVHRDVKPSNILLRPTSPGAANSIQLESLDHPVVPLLSDFGIARAVDSPELTSMGRTVGTPAYMAPEQCAGRREIDGRADIYSLGAVLYRCVVGHLPFSGSTTQILHAHVYEPLTIGDGLLRRLSPLFVEILQRSMAKRPEDRYASAAEMADDLAHAAGRNVPPTFVLPTDEVEPGSATATLTLSSVMPTPTRSSGGSSTILVPASSLALKPATESASQTSAIVLPVEATATPQFSRTKRKSARWLAPTLAAMAALILVSAVAVVSIRYRWQSAPTDGVAATQPGSTTPQLAILAQAGTTATPIATSVATSIPTSSEKPTSTPSPSSTAMIASAALTESRAPAQAFAPPPAQPLAQEPPLGRVLQVEPVTPTGIPAQSEDSLPQVDTLTPTEPPQETPQVGEGKIVLACPYTVDAHFSGILTELDEQVRAEFLCPTASAKPGGGDLLPFEHGFMLRLDETPLIYVYYAGTQEWEQVADTWQEGQSEPDPEMIPPQDTLFLPERAFAQAWDNEQRQIALGFATASTPRRFDAISQTFPGGFLVGDIANGSVYRFLRTKLRL